MHTRTLAIMSLAALVFLVPRSGAQEANLRFEDLAEKLGLSRYLANSEYGHGAGWGDVDGDGRPDLYMGAFANRPMYGAADAPGPNFLFLNKPDGFELSEKETLGFTGRRGCTSQVTFVDLDNDGDLDLVVGFFYRGGDDIGTRIFENLGGVKFRDVTPKDNWCSKVAVRNIAAVDMNGDGLLDLVVCDGTYGAKPDRILMVYENKGNFKFELVSERYGFPRGGRDQLGLAVGDVNNDGIFDFFVAGPNWLFVSGKDGKYHEVQPGTFVKPPSPTAMACGADFADLNGDGLLDLVTTEHPHDTPSKNHVYLNRGITDGDPKFEEVSVIAGVGKEYPTKSPINGVVMRTAQVDLQDYDNDGRVDIFMAHVYQDADGSIQPEILRNLGNTADGVPTFTPPPYDRVVGYFAPAPVADYDRDGRLDIFTCRWWAQTKASLFHNITPGGHWVVVKVQGQGGTFNRMGVGAVVRAYRPGMAGKPEGYMGRRDIAVGTGYASGEEALAHFGLGKTESVDLVIEWQGRKVVKKGVRADQYLTVPFPGSN